MPRSGPKSSKPAKVDGSGAGSPPSTPADASGLGSPSPIPVATPGTTVVPPRTDVDVSTPTRKTDPGSEDKSGRREYRRSLLPVDGSSLLFGPSVGGTVLEPVPVLAVHKLDSLDGVHQLLGAVRNYVGNGSPRGAVMTHCEPSVARYFTSMGLTLKVMSHDGVGKGLLLSDEQLLCVLDRLYSGTPPPLPSSRGELLTWALRDASGVWLISVSRLHPAAGGLAFAVVATDVEVRVQAVRGDISKLSKEEDNAVGAVLMDKSPGSVQDLVKVQHMEGAVTNSNSKLVDAWISVVRSQVGELSLEAAARVASWGKSTKEADANNSSSRPEGRGGRRSNFKPHGPSKVPLDYNDGGAAKHSGNMNVGGKDAASAGHAPAGQRERARPPQKAQGPCYICGELGHVRRTCPKAVGAKDNANSKNVVPKARAVEAGEELPTLDALAIARRLDLSPHPQPSGEPIISVLIGGVRAQVRVDTGCDSDLVCSEEHVVELLSQGADIKDTGDKVPLRGYLGDKTEAKLYRANIATRLTTTEPFTKECRILAHPNIHASELPLLGWAFLSSAGFHTDLWFRPEPARAQ